jgi:hypothetical protein
MGCTSRYRPKRPLRGQRFWRTGLECRWMRRRSRKWTRRSLRTCSERSQRSIDSRRTWPSGQRRSRVSLLMSTTEIPQVCGMVSTQALSYSGVSRRCRASANRGHGSMQRSWLSISGSSWPGGRTAFRNGRTFPRCIPRPTVTQPASSSTVPSEYSIRTVSPLLRVRSLPLTL